MRSLALVPGRSWRSFEARRSLRAWLAYRCENLRKFTSPKRTRRPIIAISALFTGRPHRPNIAGKSWPALDARRSFWTRPTRGRVFAWMHGASLVGRDARDSRLSGSTRFAGNACKQTKATTFQQVLLYPAVQPALVAQAARECNSPGIPSAWECQCLAMAVARLPPPNHRLAVPSGLFCWPLPSHCPDASPTLAVPPWRTARKSASPVAHSPGWFARDCASTVG